MSATRISLTSDGRVVRGPAQLDGFTSRSRRGHRLAPRDHRTETVDDLSQSPRMRALASFLGCDPQSVAGGIVDAVQRDPMLRAQRL